jgi:hypothetical protein
MGSSILEDFAFSTTTTTTTTTTTMIVIYQVVVRSTDGCAGRGVDHHRDFAFVDRFPDCGFQFFWNHSSGRIRPDFDHVLSSESQPVRDRLIKLPPFTFVF